jgi:hypothetical protein
MDTPVVSLPSMFLLAGYFDATYVPPVQLSAAIDNTGQLILP